MRKRAAVVVAALTVLVGLTACDSDGDQPPLSSSSISPTPTPADVSEHESGPDSPIAYGLQVPRGATQLGPLVRYRSAALIAAYQPELDAALAQKEAEDQRKRAEAEAQGTPLPSPTPTPTNGSRPGDDTFKPIENPPKPDTTVSLMRIDGSPTEVLRRMVAQIATVLPDAHLVLDDLDEYCKAKDRRIQHCDVSAEGETKNKRQLRITLSVDPGDVVTRTSPPSAHENPIMVLKVAYIGDPRRGQVDRQKDGDVDVPQNAPGKDTSDFIWPKMDVDSPPTTSLLNGWKAPLGASILLSGYRPRFVALATETAVQADQIASDFVSTVGTPTKDVVEDLNEVSTTYTAERKNGERATATYVLSARGNYAMLFYDPPAKKK
ncbi:hypothetical protein [Aeromicrobium terrae]|uniref:Uncharacterized protein n=1 Tax=Aeromicrobium terrae TaxID=2498846 RepID=A0A5C8NH14_9ACTN|nr:hypothetical protein [Aeromicrobium terrae]TXL58039.1 hypothetical protein FHP06_11995 [Aeromicrobium terrae]